MAQKSRHLPCKLEDCSLDPQNSCKCWMGIMDLLEFQSQKVENRVFPEASWLSRLAVLVKSWNWETLQKIKWKSHWSRRVPICPPHTYTNIHGKHHTYIYRKRKKKTKSWKVNKIHYKIHNNKVFWPLCKYTHMCMHLHTHSHIGTCTHIQKGVDSKITIIKHWIPCTSFLSVVFRHQFLVQGRTR